VKIPYKYLKWTLYTVILLFMFFLQFTKGMLPQFFGTRPVLLIAFVVCLAMYEGDTYGGAFGLITGLLWDFSANRVFGYNAILLMAIGIVVGLIATYLMQNNIFSALILCGAAIFLVETSDWFFYYVLWGYDLPIYVFFRYYFLTMVYSALSIPIYHYGFKLAKGKMKEENAE